MSRSKRFRDSWDQVHVALFRAAANAQGSTSVANGGGRGSVRGTNQRCFEHIQQGCCDCDDLNHYKGNPACHSPTAAQAEGAEAPLFLCKGKRGEARKYALALMAAVIVYCFSNCANTDSPS